MPNPFRFFCSVWFVLFVSFDVHFFVSALAGNLPVLDEVYYLSAVREGLVGVAGNLEHPPLVKVLLGGSVWLFGDWWFAWRLPIVVCSLVATYLTYFVARRFLSERASVYAAALLSLSTIFLLTGSFALLDVPCLMFGLLGLYFVLNNRFVLGGFAFGLSFLCKELAVLLFGATWLFLALRKTKLLRQVLFVGLAVSVAVGGVWVYDLAYRPVAAGVVVSNPFQHFYVMVAYQLKLNNMRSWSQWYPPVAWVSPFGVNAWNPLSWLWARASVGGRFLFDFAAQPNLAVEYMMFPLLLVLPVLYWKRREVVGLLSWLWVGFSFVPWLVAGFFVRTEANFYIVYSVPFLAVGSAYVLSLIKNRRVKYALAVLQLAVGLASFLFWFPLPVFR